MRKWRLSVMWATVVAAGLIGASCASEHEDGDESDRGLLAASSVTPSPAPPATPTPTATPTPVPPSTPTPAPTPPPTSGVTVSFNQDIKPIMNADCVRCHGGLANYSGVMTYVTPGSANSLLITYTQAGGRMNGYLSGDRIAKADLIRRWIVDNRAAESR